jgi:hypothetical protein
MHAIKPNFWPTSRKKRDGRHSANQIHVFFLRSMPGQIGSIRPIAPQIKDRGGVSRGQAARVYSYSPIITMRKRLSAWSPIVQALATVQRGGSNCVPYEERSLPMPKFPSSQTKVAPISQANLPSAIKAAMARVPTRHLSMKMKVEKLRLTKSDDPIQQLQSDIISDLYDAVRDLQVMVDPLILFLPDV